MAATRIELPPERQVVHDCDARFERPLFHDHTGWNVRATACLRCGAASVTEAIVDEPVPHDVRCVANIVLPLDDDLLSWLAEWPRRIGDPWGGAAWLFASHEARCPTLEAVAESIQKVSLEDAQRPRLERLVRAGVPRRAPPQGLPEALESYAQIHEAVYFPVADLPSLMRLIARSPWAVAVHDETLRARPDLASGVEAALDDVDLHAVALDLAGRFVLTTPRILTFVDASLRAITTETQPARAVLHLAAQLDSKSLLGALDVAAAHVDRQREYFFHDSIVTVAKRLRNRR